ncbi:lantibiotic dehydratase family protein [Saccharothrix sp. AJ9571]|nr:lantibiotic dehydratase family protein [Saccharothrix sp. AJ9571]
MSMLPRLGYGRTMLAPARRRLTTAELPWRLSGDAACITQSH